MEEERASQLFSAPQAGQPGKPSEQPEAGKVSFDPDAFKAEIVKAVGGVVTEQLEKRDRAAQSRQDKFEARVKKENEATLQALQAIGVVPTPEQQKVIHQQNAQKVMAEFQSEPSAGQPAQAPAQEPPTPARPLEDWMLRIRDRLYAKHGVELGKDDPELASVRDDDEPTMYETLDAALTAKKMRQARAAAGAAQGRMPILPASGQPSNANPLEGITDPIELLTRAFSKRPAR
jgi:hypothetical protein